MKYSMYLCLPRLGGAGKSSLTFALDCSVNLLIEMRLEKEKKRGEGRKDEEKQREEVKTKSENIYTSTDLLALGSPTTTHQPSSRRCK